MADDPAGIARRVLIVEDDAETRLLLRNILEREGYAVDVVDSRVEAIAYFETRNPDAVVIDVLLGDGSGLDVLGAIRGSAASLHTPVVMLSAIHEFSRKLEAIRQGADAWFEKPIDAESLVRKLRQLIWGRLEIAGRVLVVEDDPLQATWISNLLSSAGHELRVTSDPRTFEDDLREFIPDLVILDIRVPGATGYELARFLRQDDRYATVPILFMTAGEGDGIDLKAVIAGGDDCLRKPVAPALLLGCIRARLSRAASLRELLEIDTLSGVLTRRSFDERVTAALAAKSRHPVQTQYSLALIDIDRFKMINDTYGHLAGDRVIASLGGFLRKHLRLSDPVGRWGGDEFAVLFAGTGSDTAKIIMAKLVAEFRQIEHPAAGGASFRAAFSAGISELRDGQTIAEWKGAADVELYEAKRKGGGVEVDRDAIRKSNPVLSSEVVGQIVELGKRAGTDLFAELALLFVEQLPARTNSIRAAVTTADYAALADETHAFFSAAGNIGARRLSIICGKVEAAARSADAEAIERLAPVLFDEMEAAGAALRARIPIVVNP
jgi:diguanylate cyclase (GGDEF)-like protein